MLWSFTVLVLLSVRPLAGAGIEIWQREARSGEGNVRPLAGAGIEIFNPEAFRYILEFAPSRGRELK